MRKEVFVLLTAFCLAALPSVMAALTAESSIGDAYVRTDKPNDNFGDQGSLWIGGSEGEVSAGLIKFTQTVPDNSVVNSAALRLYFFLSCLNPENPANITIRRITSDWEENEVTLNTKPTYSSVVEDWMVLTDGYGWVEFDVTDVVQGWVDGTYENYGLGLLPNKKQPVDTIKRFYTKDKAEYPELHPQLVIDYTAP